MTTILPVLRRSAIQTANACLYRYNKVWNEGISDMSDEALRGIGFHACAHRYIQRLIECHTSSDHDEAVAAFEEGIASVLTPRHLVTEIRSLYDWWTAKFQLDNGAFLAAEEHQQSDESHVFTPDLVYGRPDGLEIVDFKTYFLPLTEAQAKVDFQARFYIHNAMRIWPNFPNYTFTFAWVRFGTSTSVTFSQEDVESLRREVVAVAGTIEEATARNEWPATPGVECRFCQLQCPVVDQPMVHSKRALDLAGATKAAGLILAGEQMLKTAKKALKAYCAANGPVQVAGVEFDNRPVMQRSYPVAEVVKILQQRGVFGAFDADNGLDLTISHSALGKLLKAYPDLEADLQPFQSHKLTYRFGAMKPGVGEDDDA